MVGENLFTDEFLSEISLNSPDIEKIKKHIISAYNIENNAALNLDSPLSESQEKDILRWLNTIEFEHQYAPLLYSKRVEVSLPYISSSLSQKIISLSQFHCPICSEAKTHPITIIPIRISAISKQASSAKINRAFARAIKHELSLKKIGWEYKKGQKLCLYILFVMGRKTKNKDLDNLSKAMLDSLKGDLFYDDIDVDHLNLVKIRVSGIEDFVIVNIRKSFLNEHKNVIFKSFNHTWEDKAINLSDFLE